MSDPPGTPSDDRDPTGLVDRERELGLLDRATAAALEGDGAFLVLEGPAGIGKSALLRTLAARPALDGATVLRARAGELEQEFAFGVVRQLFEATLGGPQERARRLSGAAAAADPVFHAVGEGGTAEAGAFAMLHGLYWLAADLAAERPLVLLVDDLHWCDAASLRFLAYLARRLDGLPVLVATTLRTGELGSDPRLIAEILQAPTTEEVGLTPLTPAASALLVRDRLGADADPAFCTACHEASAGNPLLLRQLLRALESDRVAPTAGQVATVLEVGPRAVARTVLVRLDRLPEEALRLARAVSILGDGADLDVAASFAGLDRRAAAAATGPLARAEILRPDLPLEFVHPLVRAAVYLEQPAGERAAGHAAAADALREAGADREQVAKQLLLGRPRGEEWVVAALHDAALEALTRGAPESAAAYLRRALEEPPPADRRGRLLYDLGRAVSLNDGPRGVAVLQEALEHLVDPQLRMDAAMRLPQLLTLVGQPLQAQELCRELVAQVPAHDVDARAGLLAHERMAAHFSGSHAVAPDEEPAVPPLHATTAGEKRLLAIIAFQRSFGDRPAAEVVPLALAALAGGVLIPVDETYLSVAALRVLVDADHPATMDLWEEALADAHRQGSLGSILGIQLWRGYTLLRRGDLGEAGVALDRAGIDLAAWGDSPLARAYQSGFRSDVHRETGEYAQAWASIDAVEGFAPPLSEAARLLDLARVRLLLAEHRADEALVITSALRRDFAHITNPALQPVLGLEAQALAATGRADDAQALLEEELRRARIWGTPGTVGPALRRLGELRRDEAQLREAVELLADSPARLEHARALLALGVLLRRDDRPADAREPLRAAFELAGSCGALPLADDAKAQLYATGARPRTAALSGAAALTASERRVADLAASGRTNRDIAQELYVTTKTVEVHLSASYRKLGIASRRELEGALAAAP